MTQLKNLNEQVLKEVKPLQPVLEDLNTDSAKLAKITDSILTTSKGAEQEAEKTQGLVAKLAAGAAESDRIIGETAAARPGCRRRSTAWSRPAARPCATCWRPSRRSAR